MSKWIRKKKNNMTTSFSKKILVTKLMGIGNVINISPLIIKLKELMPDYDIDFLCNDKCKKIFDGWKCINKVYTYPSTYHNIQNINYEFVITGVPHDKVIDGLLRNRKVYINTNPMFHKTHEIEANMKILLKLGWNGQNIPHTYIHISPQDEEKINKQFKDKYIGICAGWSGSSQWSIKNWGYKNYAQLTKLLKSYFPEYKILILGTGYDRKVLNYIKFNEMDRIIDCVDKYSINETAAIIKKCKFIVVNDSGLSHVASAIDTRSYTIFGPTSTAKNKPPHNNIVIKKNLNCVPCQFTSRWMKCKTIECLRTISPSDVAKKIYEVENLL